MAQMKEEYADREAKLKVEYAEKNPVQQRVYVNLRLSKQNFENMTGVEIALVDEYVVMQGRGYWIAFEQEENYEEYRMVIATPEPYELERAGVITEAERNAIMEERRAASAPRVEAQERAKLAELKAKYEDDFAPATG